MPNSMLWAEDSTTAKPVQLQATSDALHGFEQGKIAGERNVSSTTGADHSITQAHSNLSIISKQTAVTIGGGAAGDTHLNGIMITAALAGTCAITGFADSDDAATTYTLPAATPAGYYDFQGAVNSAGALTITCSNAADNDLVAIFWRAV